MAWFTVIKALIPVITVLIEMLFPKLKEELEDIWEFVENLIPTENPELPKASIRLKKQDLWNERARALLTNKGINATDARLNLLREITHARMTSPKRKK